LYKVVKFDPKSKRPVYISWLGNQHLGFIFTIFSLVFFNYQAKGQINDTIPVITLDTLDSAKIIDSDTIPLTQADSIATNRLSIDSVQTEPANVISTTVFYKSRDSLHMNMQTMKVSLYGKSSIEYDPIALDAEEITIDWGENIIEAHGVPDSTGNEVGKPIFRSGSEEYETNNIRYNFKTEKAVISGLVTKQGEGIIHGREVYKNEKDELYIPYTKYTTCNLAHPHFYIAARDVKAIPNNKLITGPFNMVINEVPTPLGFFFGMFPEQNQRASGIIIPSYGEQNLKGFYLEEGGYFFAINDYMNLGLTGSIYSKGGYGLNVRSRYIKRYKYNGNFTFNLTKQNFSSDAEATESQVTDFRINWSHSPKTKGTGRFSARVNAATSTYNQNNVLQDIDQQINATLSSSVSYHKTFKGTPISMGINTRFNQNVQTKKVDLLLPEISMNVQNIYPFQSKAGGSKSWYNRLTFRYTMNAVNQITNRISADSIAPFDLKTLPKLIENARNGVKHIIPISTSLKAFKYFTISPSVNYQELWYSSKLNYTYDSSTGSIVTDTIPGFNRVYSYNAGVGMNTRMYGTYFFNREYGIQAIRHVLNPSLSYSYRPDFSDPKFDYYQEVQSNESGDTVLKRRYVGYLYGQPGAGKSSALSFSLTNTLEMKTKSRRDTTGTTEKVALLRNFGLSASYNLAADSFNLSTIALRATTTLLNNKEVFGGSATMMSTNINLTGNIDPYVWQLDSVKNPGSENAVFYQKRKDKFAWNNGQGLGQFSRLTLSLRTGIRAKTRKEGGNKGQRNYATSEVDRLQQRLTDPSLSYHEQVLIENILDNPEYYVDFNIPWSISLTYTVNYRQLGHAQGEVTQTLRFNGDVSLTKKWKLTYNSGYDFVKKDLTLTRIGLFRDLHCWELNFNWVPFGRFTSYDFSIRAKSSLLQDLKLNRRRSFTDNLF